MSEASAPPPKRRKFELSKSFDVLVGKGAEQQHFAVHHDVLTKRSGFFRAARSPQWLEKPSKPTVLVDDDPEVFDAYLNCAYFGIEMLRDGDGRYAHLAGESEPESSDGEDENDSDSDDESVATDEKVRAIEAVANEQYKTLTAVHVLAAKLQDPETANMATDEILRIQDLLLTLPNKETTNFVYESTTRKSHLRMLIRDFWLHHPSEIGESKYILEGGYPAELSQEIVSEYLRIKKRCKCTSKKKGCFCFDKWPCMNQDKYHYHMHDEQYPRCTPKPDT